MDNIRECFTKWYYRRGYRMKFDVHELKLKFICPFWIKPFANTLFSPCAYYRELRVEAYV